MQNYMIGRSPIIDTQGDIEAYDIFFVEDISEVGDKRCQSSMLINAITNTFGIKNILGDKKGFIRVEKPFLLSDAITGVAKEHFVFAIATDTIVDDRLLDRVYELHTKGYRFSLDNMTFAMGPLRPFMPLLEYLDYFKVNSSEFSERYLAKLLHALSPYSLEVVACNIDTHMEYAIAQSVRAKLVQGEYFSEPIMMQKPSFDPKLFNIIQIYNKILSEASMQEIVHAFEASPALSIQLMQFMNSAAFSFKERISSIEQIVAMMGLAPLAQWLLLQIYGKSMNKSPYQSPLLLKVTARIELMQGLIRLLNPTISQEGLSKAYFVAVMSLSSTVFSLPLRMILKEIPISEDVEKALLEHHGLLGELLHMIRAIEKFETKTMSAFAKKYKIPAKEIQKVIIESMKRANAIEGRL